MTIDEILATELHGEHVRERYIRMSEYLINGERLGSLELETKTESQNDTHVNKHVGEILHAATAFALANYEHVSIRSKNDSGRQLESPDLDVTFENGQTVGVEVAEAYATDLARHEAELNRIEMHISDRLDSDGIFAKAFGQYFVSVNAGGFRNTVHPFLGKKQARAIIAELESLFEGGFHRTCALDSLTDIPKEFSMLHSRSASVYVSLLPGATNFSITDGGGTVDRNGNLGEIERVVAGHREAALNYRLDKVWLVVALLDTNEIFKSTYEQLSAHPPNISPFQKLFVFDPFLRLKVIDG